jgi:hypothetical protein
VVKLSKLRKITKRAERFSVPSDFFRQFGRALESNDSRSALRTVRASSIVTRSA